MAMTFDHALVQRDATLAGLTGAGLARKARVSKETVARFYRGGSITATTAAKLSKALGYRVERYLLETAELAVSR